MITHKLINNKHGDGIECLCCGLVSYNINDIMHKYCGFCHMFHEDPIEIKQIIIKQNEKRIWKLKRKL